MKPRVGVVIGDPSGIGPELAAKLIALPETLERAEVLIIGDKRVFQAGAAVAGVAAVPVHVVTDAEAVDFSMGNPQLLDISEIDPAEVPVGEISAACGAATLKNYRTALKLAQRGVIDGFCFTPFNKGALHLGGNEYEDELQFAAHELKFSGRVSEFNVMDGIWNARVTSHVPLREVADRLNIERIVEAIKLADKTLRSAGFSRPRIAVAALNPHAGDNGAIGREEIDIIGPAIAQAQALQLHAEGPFPGDTLYLRLRDGHYDCALTMYHDQGQIAIKLMGFDRGVSLLGGLPFPVTTPAHGTAFDIAGQGKANLEPTRRAFVMLCEMAQNRRAAA